MIQQKDVFLNVQKNHGLMQKIQQGVVFLDAPMILLVKIIQDNVLKVVPLGILSLITRPLFALLTVQLILSQIILQTDVLRPALQELMVIIQHGNAFQPVQKILHYMEMLPQGFV